MLRYENTDREFVHEVTRALYVDDFASGKNTLKDCFELYQNLKALFREGRFNMRKWASNHQELNQLLEKEETIQLSRLEQFSEIALLSTRSDKIEDNGCSEATSKKNIRKQRLIKCMGVPWNRTEDCLRYNCLHTGVNHWPLFDISTGLQNPSRPSERRRSPSSRADGSLNTSKLNDSSV